MTARPACCRRVLEHCSNQGTTTPLTRSLRETVADRAKASPGFRAALVEDAMQALADGDVETARALLHDVANATLGFQAFARETGIPRRA